MDLVFRFLVGGVTVLAFAAFGDVLKPKSFAGLFSAAPSVGIATLGLTIFEDGAPHAAIEARSMIVGAVSFVFYACTCTRLIMKYEVAAGPASIAGLALWFALSIGGWSLLLQ